MLNITGNARVFDITVQDKYVEATLSTSKKGQDGEYTYQSWKTRFVGNCKKQAEQLNEKDFIKINNGIVENTYNKETKKGYVNVVVFEYEMYEKKQEQKPEPKRVEEKNPFEDTAITSKIDDDMLPF
jgi:hypothetical protein